MQDSADTSVNDTARPDETSATWRANHCPTGANDLRTTAGDCEDDQRDRERICLIEVL